MLFLDGAYLAATSPLAFRRIAAPGEKELQAVRTIRCFFLIADHIPFGSATAKPPGRKGLDSTVARTLELHQLVAERGVAGMYEYYETQRRLKAEREADEATRLREAQ